MNAGPRSLEAELFRRFERYLVVVGNRSDGGGIALSAVDIVSQRRARSRLSPLRIQRDVRSAKLHQVARVVPHAAAIGMNAPSEERLTGRRRQLALRNFGKAALRILELVRRHRADTAVRIVAHRAALVVNVVRIELDSAKGPG